MGSLLRAATGTVLVDMDTGINCEDGYVVPLWPLGYGLSYGERAARGIIYFLILFYLFLGMAVYLNKLMESMETMLSLMKRVSVPNLETGENKVIFVKIWNSAVANMFMAAGSLAPVICVAIMDIIARNYQSGDIGPGTIIGSVAFNLLVSIGVAISVVPINQVKKVQNMWDYLVLGVCSVALFVWIDICLSFMSYGYIELFEAFSIIIFCVITICFILATSMLGNKRPKLVSYQEQYQNNFNMYKEAMQTFQARNPEISDKTLLVQVSECGAARQPRSWAYYVMKATNKIAGRCEPLFGETAGINSDEATTDFNLDDGKVTVEMNKASEESNSNVDRILIRANNGDIWSCSLWKQQFKNLCSLQNLGGRTRVNVIVHILTVPWKFWSAFIPPAQVFGGYLAFILTLINIFKLSAWVVDISGHIGCFIHCKEFVIGVLILPVGLNIPNMFASIIAAKEEKTADLPIFSLFSANFLSASLGFGLPWFLAWEEVGRDFIVAVIDLSFYLKLLIGLIIIAVFILVGRRCCLGGGELGGNIACQIITTILFLVLWIFFVAIVVIWCTW